MGSASRGRSAVAKADYVCREGRYSRQADRLESAEHGNMPEWAREDARKYWAAADAHERSNGRLYVEVQCALPRELDAERRRALAAAFAERLCGPERLPYTLALHAGGGDNPHFHLVISERRNDGVARPAERWFRRANSKAPERGGARKTSRLRQRSWPKRMRAQWAEEANRALAAAGRAERIDPRRLAEQAREALERGDLERAAELSREPEPKRGAGEAVQRRYEAGRAPEPSRAVAECREVRRSNAEWLSECRERAGAAERAREEAAAAEEEAARAARRLERAREETAPARLSPEETAELRELERAARRRDLRAINRAGGVPAMMRRTAALRRKAAGEPEPPPAPARPPAGWRRYKARWPGHAKADKRIFGAMAGRFGEWRLALRERFERLMGRWGGWRLAQPKGLPRELAPPGGARPDAAPSRWAYRDALPERYRKRWDKSGLNRRAAAAQKRAERTRRYRWARDKGALVEDAVRQECGPQAQKLDREMREDRQRYRPYWDVLRRRDTMRDEERKAERRSRERARYRDLPDRLRGRGSRGRGRGGPSRGGGWSR